MADNDHLKDFLHNQRQNVMAQECMSFTKYSTFLELESRHSVDMGPAYSTGVSAKSFTHYIAESQRQNFLSLFVFFMDGTTDSGNLEDELVMVQLCWKDCEAKVIKSCAR